MIYSNIQVGLHNLYVILTTFAVKYEAQLEDGTIVSKTDVVEFAVKDGMTAKTIIYFPNDQADMS